MTGQPKAGQKVLIASGLSRGQEECQRPIFLDLPEPRTGIISNYLLMGNILQECNLHQPRFSSWFVGDSVVQDGALNLCTPIDPLFIVLPALEKARVEGKFCDIEQCLECTGCSGSRLLTPLLESQRQMECVCDSKVAGGCTYYRLSEDKLLAWLKIKVNQTKRALAAPGTPFASMENPALTAYAAGLVAEYIQPSLGVKLSTALGLDKLSSDARSNGAPGGYNPAAYMPRTHAIDPSNKKPRLDPAAAAKAKAAESRHVAKAAKLAKEAAGMSKLSRFFGAKPSK